MNKGDCTEIMHSRTFYLSISVSVFLSSFLQGNSIAASFILLPKAKSKVKKKSFSYLGGIQKPRSQLGGRGVSQKDTTLHNSYLVKVATWGGRGSKFSKKWLRGFWMTPYLYPNIYAWQSLIDLYEVNNLTNLDQKIQ